MVAVPGHRRSTPGRRILGVVHVETGDCGSDCDVSVIAIGCGMVEVLAHVAKGDYDVNLSGSGLDRGGWGQLEAACVRGVVGGFACFGLESEVEGEAPYLCDRRVEIDAAYRSLSDLVSAGCIAVRNSGCDRGSRLGRSLRLRSRCRPKGSCCGERPGCGSNYGKACGCVFCVVLQGMGT